MAFRVIKGTFHIAGYAPDGDSVRFKAANPAWWSLLDGPKVGLNAKQHAQLRIEAIDTLETHFETFHQPLDLADQATEFLLRQLGITEVQWNATRTKVTHARDGTPGFIITRTTERNRRPVAFVYAGRTERADGSEVFLDRRLIRRSINYRTLWAGMAYPTYYQGLFYDLRDTLTSAVLKARAERLGVWRRDRTTRGFEVDGVDGLMNVVVVGIQHTQGRMEFNPLASTVLHGGDHLIVLGSSRTLKELEQAAK